MLRGVKWEEEQHIVTDNSKCHDFEELVFTHLPNQQAYLTTKEISFRMLRDVLRETWTNSDIAQEAREEGLPSGFQQAFLQGLQQAHREVLQEFRQTLLKIVRVRFPQAVRLAKKQTADLEDSAVLRDLIVKLSVAQTAEEAVIHLLEVDEDEEDED
jgi:flagellar biosynthesis/type III secretory pathway protein FliH